MILSKLRVRKSRLDIFSHSSLYDSIRFRTRTLLCMYDYRRKIKLLSNYSSSNNLLSDYYAVIGTRRGDICIGPLSHIVELLKVDADADYDDCDDYISYENDEGGLELNSLTTVMNVTANKLQSSISNEFSNKSSFIAEHFLQILKSKMKDYFGKEYYLSNCTQQSFMNKKLLKFIEKYDPNFDIHYFKHNESLGSFISICPVRADTYIYIATNKYVPDSVTNAIIYKNDSMKFDMYIYIFGKKSRALCNVLDRILEDRKRCNKGNRIYNIYEISSDHGNSITTIDLKYREMSNMYYSFNELDIIKNHINSFIKNKKLYEEKQILYKTGILLYGEPGTGKSTLAKAIATEYHRSIVTINMSNIFKIDFASLAAMINSDIYDEYIILLEDIDTLFLNREENNSTESKNYNDIINKLLQFLDSNTSPNNVIFIATTNHLERLDNALLRDGRFDLKIEIKGLKEKDICNMVDSFGVSRDHIPEIVDTYNKSINKKDVEDILYNQSKLQNIVIKYI